MQVFVPYTRLSEATLISLIGYDFRAVRLKGKYGYGRYFKDRWAEGLSFINLEHDCVPWGGAIDSLINCSEPWCAFNYSLPVHKLQNLSTADCVPLGLVKISDTLINLTKGLWDELVDWSHCDQHLSRRFLAGGFTVHEHKPSIINANKALLPLAKGTYE